MAEQAAAAGEIVPPDVVADLAGITAALDGVIPARREQNLLVATWNLRAFAGLTQKWLAGPKDSPKRDWHAIACVAQIVSRFDLVAIQEIRRNTAAARFLLQRLGPDWADDPLRRDRGRRGQRGAAVLLLPPRPGAAVRPGR